MFGTDWLDWKDHCPNGTYNLSVGCCGGMLLVSSWNSNDAVGTAVIGFCLYTILGIVLASGWLIYDDASDLPFWVPWFVWKSVCISVMRDVIGESLVGSEPLTGSESPGRESNGFCESICLWERVWGTQRPTRKCVNYRAEFRIWRIGRNSL
jgi:hypothetical protein